MRRGARAAIAFAAAAGALCGAAAPLPAAEEPGSSGGAQVIVARATTACFSDMVRGTGFVVPRKEAVVMAESEGSRVTEILVREGDLVTENQELIRLTPPPQGGPARPLRASAAGLITEIKTIVGAPASPQQGPIVRIAVNNEIEVEAEVPGMHALKISPGASARISRDDGADVVGRVRVVSPEIDRRTQLAHVRIALGSSSGLKVGMFARVSIDARRSCGVAIPRSAVDHLTVQVVKGGATIETRRVRTGLRSDTAIEIVEGVKDGEIVVADAGTSLHDGDPVKPIFPDDLDRVRGR